MTIPIKARAIKKSCIISVPIRRSAVLDSHLVKALAAHSPLLGGGDAATRESKAQTDADEPFLQPIYQCIIGGMRGILKYHEKLAGYAEVVESVTLWSVTKGTEMRREGRSSQ